MARRGPFLAVVGLLLVALAASGTALAQDQGNCDGPLMGYPGDVLQDSWVRVEIENRGPPAQVVICVIEQDTALKRAIHTTIVPAADNYNHTFQVVAGTFEIKLRAVDPSGSTSSGVSTVADLEVCTGVVWRTVITYVPGVNIPQPAPTDCEETVPDEGGEPSAKPGARLVALPWTATSSFAKGTTEGPPVWAWGLAAAPVALLAWYRPLAWFLFTRIARPEVLNQRHRARIFDLVKADPGIHFEEVGRRLELANGAVRHHVGLLLRNQLILEIRTHGKRCLFVPEAGPRASLEARAALTVPTARRVYESLQQGPNRLDEVARAAGISTSQARRWLRELASFGLVEGEIVTGRKQYRIRGSMPGSA